VATAFAQNGDEQMPRLACILAALLAMTLPPTVQAQQSSGHMDLEGMDTRYGVRLVVFRVMFSATEVMCPRQTGLFRIRPDGG
jgi:hypothetical protein